MLYNPYSVSKMGTFNTCAKQFEFKYIQKIKIDSVNSLALQRGSFSHEVLEHDFNYNIKFPCNEIFTQEEKDKTIKMLEDFKKSELGQQVQKLIKVCSLEEDFAYNSKLEAVGFFDKTGWIRGSADLYLQEGKKGKIFDYKTGKDKSKEKGFGEDQAKMYSINMFLKYPEIEEVKAIFLFIEHSTQKELIFYKKDFNSYVKYFYDKTKLIENTEVFTETVSALCGFCDYFTHGYCKAPDEAEDKTQDMLKTKISLDF